jgi:predicted GIY-YIG superfamily endonuclease
MTVTLYILKLEGGRYYIGTTTQYDTRIADHIAGKGSEWTKIHKVENVIHIEEIDNKFSEDAVTLDYMSKHGVENVRGGMFSNPKLSAEDLEYIRRATTHASGGCFKCGKVGHFSRECSSRRDRGERKYKLQSMNIRADGTFNDPVFEDVPVETSNSSAPSTPSTPSGNEMINDGCSPFGCIDMLLYCIGVKKYAYTTPISNKRKPPTL